MYESAAGVVAAIFSWLSFTLPGTWNLNCIKLLHRTLRSSFVLTTFITWTHARKVLLSHAKLRIGRGGEEKQVTRDESVRCKLSRGSEILWGRAKSIASKRLAANIDSIRMEKTNDKKIWQRPYPAGRYTVAEMLAVTGHAVRQEKCSRLFESCHPLA